MQTSLTILPQDARNYAFGADSNDNVSRSYSWNTDNIPKIKDLRKYTGAIEHQLQYCALSFDNVVKNGFDFFAIRKFADIETKLNPQYIKGYTGEIIVEPDDKKFVPDIVPSNTSKSLNVMVIFVILMVLYFAYLDSGVK